jgi:5-methylcytosine-specific restriction enzyme subunit McrC
VSTSRIPIENLYYLLCYAWNQLEQGQIADVSRLESTELVDLFARVLNKGVDHLARRGLEQIYVAHQDELRGIRGKIELLPTERRMLRRHGRAACMYDDLSVNSIPNQIIKSSLRALGRHPSINAKNRAAVMKTVREMQGVQEIPITSGMFRRVQLHSNSRHYRFLLNVCELIHGFWLVDEKSGAYRFREFLEDGKKMAYVFQLFVFNFLRIERPDLHVHRENIPWQTAFAADASFLPIMQTDVSMDIDDRHIILDTKYYRDTLVEYYGSKKLRTEHLYQLFSYLVNRGATAGACEGILLYPTVDITLSEQFNILGFQITVRTLNLAQSWQSLHADLYNLISTSK